MTPHLTWHDYAVLTLFFIGQFLVGAYFTRREKNTDTFFVGNRNIVWWAAGLSIFGTAISAITFLAIPATAYASNWSSMMFNMGTLFLAPFIALVYLPRLRLANLTTAYEYLDIRFNTLARFYGAAVFFTFQLGRMGIMLYLPAVVLHTATGMSIQYSILTMGVITTIYTVMGGIEAVIWTDVLQTVLIMGSALYAVWLVFAGVNGGPVEVIRMAADENKFELVTWSLDITSASVFVVVVGGIFANAYPMLADQTVVQKYLTTSNPRNAAKAMWTNAALTLPVQLIFFGLGTGLWAFYKQHPEQLNTSLRNDAILPQFVMQEFPPGMRGVLIAAVFAASMSSLASSINSLATVSVNDFYRRFVRNVPDRRALWIARGLTAVYGFFGTGSALYVANYLGESTVFETYLSFLGLVGGGLAAIYVLGTCTTRANGRGVLIGAVVSAAVLIFLRLGSIEMGDTVMHAPKVHPFLYAFIGFTICFVVGYLASLAFPAPKPEIESRA